MAKKSDDKAATTTITFRCPADVADDLKVLARIDGCACSDFLREMVSGLVKANKARIKKFRQSAAVPIKKTATFAAAPNKPDAKGTNADASTSDKGGDQNESY